MSQFGLKSTKKRSRGHISDSKSAPSNDSLLVINHFSEDFSSRNSYVLSNNCYATIVISNQENSNCYDLILRPIIGNTGSIRIPINIRINSNEAFILCCHQYPSNSCEYVVASTLTGEIEIINVKYDGKILSNVNNIIPLGDNDKDKISTLINTGNGHYIVGTSNGNLIIVSNKSANDVKLPYKYRLQREKLSLFGLMKSINKIFGDSHANENTDESYENNKILYLSIVIPVATPSLENSNGVHFDNSVLISISSTVSLWSHWIQQSISQFKDFNLQNLIIADLQTLDINLYHHYQILSVCPLSLGLNDTTANTAKLQQSFTRNDIKIPLIFGVLSSVSHSLSSLETLSLYFHAIELSSWNNFSQTSITIKHRFLITSNLEFVARFQPRLYLNSSDYVFVAYSDATTNDTLAAGTSTIKVLNVNINSLPSLSLLPLHQRSGFYLPFDTQLPDDCISSSGITAFAGDENSNKIYFITQDGSVIQCTVKESSPSIDLPLTNTSQSVRCSHPENEASDLLEELCTENKADDVNIGRLSAMFHLLATATVERIVLQQSKTITQRSLSGQHWQKAAQKIDEDRALRKYTERTESSYQLVHQALESKVRQHSTLIHVLTRMGFLQLTRLPFTNSWELPVLQTHQCLLGAYGFCISLQSSFMALQHNAVFSNLLDTASNTKTPFTSVIFQRADESGVPVTASVKSTRLTVPTGYLSGYSSADTNIIQDAYLQQVHQSGVRTIHDGLELVVSGMWTCLPSDYESKGLSATDVYFSEVDKIADGFTCIVEIIRAQSRETGDEQIITKIIGVILVLLPSLQYTLGKAGSNSYASSFIADEQGGDRVRRALLQLLATLNQAICRLAQGAMSHSELNVTMCKLLSEESLIGHKLVEISRLLLENFSLEDSELLSYSQSNDSWLKKYGMAKETCISLLIDLGHAKSCFNLSSDFLYFPGLMESFKLAIKLEENKIGVNLPDFYSEKHKVLSRHIWNQIIEILKVSHHLKGTESECLGMYVLEWLDKQKRVPQIMQLSTIIQDEFKDFIQNRPYLAWMYHIQNEEFESAGESLVKHAQGIISKDKAKNLLSLAKLSTLLAQATQVDAQMSTTIENTPKLSNLFESNHIFSHQSCQQPQQTKAIHNDICIGMLNLPPNQSAAAIEANRGLFVIEAQNRLMTMKPNLLSKKNLTQHSARMPISNLIENYIRVAKEMTCHSGYSSSSDPSSVDLPVHTMLDQFSQRQISINALFSLTSTHFDSEEKLIDKLVEFMQDFEREKFSILYTTICLINIKLLDLQNLELQENQTPRAEVLLSSKTRSEKLNLREQLILTYTLAFEVNELLWSHLIYNQINSNQQQSLDEPLSGTYIQNMSIQSLGKVVESSCLFQIICNVNSEVDDGILLPETSPIHGFDGQSYIEDILKECFSVVMSRLRSEFHIFDYSRTSEGDSVAHIDTKKVAMALQKLVGSLFRRP